MIRFSYSAGLNSFAARPHDMWSNFPIIQMAHQRLRRTVIENSDFEKLIGLYDSPESFFYLDPPYYMAEGYYQNIGKEEFRKEDHIWLRDTLFQIEGKFLLSYNDDPYIRSLYDFQNIHLEEVRRLNNMRQRYEQGSEYQELIIANYMLHEREAMQEQLNLFE